MRVYDDICEMIEIELEDIARDRKLNPDTLEVIGEAVDIVKDISTIKAMKEASYEGGSSREGGGGSSREGGYSREGGSSNRYPYYFDDGMSMARGGRGGGGGRSGRYERYERGGGSSRNDEKEMMEEKIDELKRQLEQMR